MHIRSYATHLERLWQYAYRVICALVFMLWRRAGGSVGRTGEMEQAIMARLQQDLKTQFALQREEMNAQTARMVQILSADVGRMSEMQQSSLKGMSTQLVEMVRLNQARLDEMRWKKASGRCPTRTQSAWTRYGRRWTSSSTPRWRSG